jgi:hypothetical protein
MIMLMTEMMKFDEKIPNLLSEMFYHLSKVPFWLFLGARD